MAEPTAPVRVRYAPSPTGHTHLGGARTALFNYLFARRSHGAFLLRIEDTDRARLVPGSAEQIQEGLNWLGINWHEPPVIQSEHLARYRDAADVLLSSGAAYRCFCTPQRLEQMRAEQRGRHAPKHLLLFRAFGWEAPAFAHLPLVLGPDRKPLAKRHGARNVLEYRDAGYLPEAVVNFLAFLGWSPGTTQDLFGMEELSEAFSIERVQSSPAIANLERLDWLNGQWIRHLSDREFAQRLGPWLP